MLDTTPDGVISLDPDFVPSYLHAHASAYLLSCLKEVISMLGHRGDTIAERIRSNGKVGGAEVGDFMMLHRSIAPSCCCATTWDWSRCIRSSCTGCC